MALMISATGAVTSLGWDVETMAASFRAGLSLPRTLPQYQMDIGYDVVPVTGYPVFPLTEGYGSMALWENLFDRCFQDIRRHGGLPADSDSEFWGDTGLIVCLPSLDDDRYGWFDKEEANEKVLPFLFEETSLPEFAVIKAIAMGHAGIAQAVQLTHELLDAGDVSRVVVVGVDSYLDNESFVVLAEENRLKGLNPVGMIPGEGAGGFLLESEAAVQERNGQVFGLINGVACGKESSSFYANADVYDGSALAQCIKQVQEGGVDFPGQIYLDMNGEVWRSQSWGNAQVRLIDGEDFNLGEEFILAASFGEIGAASAALAVCLATQSYERGYAKWDQSLILSISEQGEVGALGILNPASTKEDKGED